MFRKIVFVSAVLALIVILTGSFLRLSGAELACPDWPECFGQIVITDDADFKAKAGLLFPAYPADIVKVGQVMGHRYLAGVLSILVLLLGVLSWRQQQCRLAALSISASLVLLLGIDAFLSIWLIKLNAMPIIETAHLLVDMMVFWLVYWLYLRSNPALSKLSASVGPIGLSRFSILVLLLQIVLGVWVSTNQAGLACNGFPACNGQWWPKADYQNGLDFFHGLASGYTGIVSPDAQLAIMWLHRIGGLASLVLLTILLFRSVSARNIKAVKTAGWSLCALLMIEIVVTYIGVKSNMPVGLALAHQIVSVLLMLPLLSISFYSRYGYVQPLQLDRESKPEVVEIGSVPVTVETVIEEVPAIAPGIAPCAPEGIPPASMQLYVEPPQASLLSRLKLQLKRTRSGLGGILASLPIGEKEINEDLLEEIEASLIMADVGIDTTNAIINRLTQQLERHQLRDGLALSVALKEELLSILNPCNEPLKIPEQDKPFVILVVGVNGAGKTTTIGKLAKRLQAQGKSVMLAAGDTFRAAAVEQLQVWGERNNIHVVAQHTGADSASVIYDGVQSAQSKGIDVLIADTAGRLHTKSNLMDELKKVKRIIGKLDETAPHEVLLVLDAGTGQNALSQAKLFNETVNLTGLVLTKLDGTAKGGVIFALAKQTGIPIRFIGIGEGIDDLQDFNAENFVDALFVKD